MSDVKTKELLSLVKKNGLLLKNILPEDQTRELCIEAIKENTFAVNYISDESLRRELCKLLNYKSNYERQNAIC